jgi:succinate-semialdehyde dehydrogenase / glutarate-semialdehyde dehydrogenase
VAIASVNPVSNRTFKTYEPHSEGEIEHRLAVCAAEFPRWRARPFADRAKILLDAASTLEARKNEWGHLMTVEMGKPVNAGIAEAEKCAWVCRYYAENGERFLADEAVTTDAGSSYVRYEPLGPVLAVMPWNFPFWQVFRFAAPALMAGNVGLLKHASNVPGCALAIEEILHGAGAPEGAFRTLLVTSDWVGRIIEDPRIAAVTLTGSEGAGVAVGRNAGAQIKKTVLELGGSDPFLVLPSADVEAAASTAVKARTINNGQSCIAAKRFIVHREVYDDFEKRFVERMAALKVGDPSDPSVDIGPLATPAIRDEVEGQVQRTVDAGGRVLLGGKRLEGSGNFYAPTVLTDVPIGSPADAEEIFGPVASLFRVASVDEAIAVANRSRYGLGSAAWTRDQAERERLVRELAAGCIFINGMVKSDPRLPFGGIKKSGYGRELSWHGIREFVNIKTVWVA